VDCPNCGLTNPEIASRCDCGYDFATGRVRFTGVRHPEVQHKRGRGRVLCGAASLIVGLSSVALFFLLQLHWFRTYPLQLHRFPTYDFGVAITTTVVALLSLVAGIVLGSIARGVLGWLGVVTCAVGLLFWLLMLVGVLL